jgi:hypothetical protein
VKTHYNGELLLFSSIVGGVVGLLKSLIHFIFSWLKLAPNFYDDINTFLVHGHSQPSGAMQIVFAEIGDSIIGAIFGVLLSLWLKNSRLKYHWWIGIAYGFGIWFISLAMGNLLKIIKPNETTPWGLFAHLLAMVVFGLLFVWSTKIWQPLRKRITTDF